MQLVHVLVRSPALLMTGIALLALLVLMIVIASNEQAPPVGEVRLADCRVVRERTSTMLIECRYAR